MKSFLSLIMLFILVSCSKPKTVLICGDHICVNKAEAEQYFEENLTIEVKIIDKKEKNKIDLVELNLRENQNGKKRISLLSKNQTTKNIKTLSINEISNIKKKIKKKKKEKKIIKKVITNNKKINETYKIKKNVNNKRDDIVDVCTILQKCSIDEISKYLIELGKNKKFPDITIRQ